MRTSDIFYGLKLERAMKFLLFSLFGTTICELLFSSRLVFLCKIWKVLLIANESYALLTNRLGEQFGKKHENFPIN